MAKSAEKKPRKAVATAAGAATVTGHAIAHRAYDLYLARGGERGHEMDDWLQAERELRRSTAV